MFASRRIDYGLLRAQSTFRQGFLPLMLPYAQFGVSGVPLPEVSSPGGGVNLTFAPYQPRSQSECQIHSTTILSLLVVR